MKNLNVFLALFFLIVVKGYNQENNSNPELRLSFITGNLASISQTFELAKFGASRTSLISGYDLKMIIPTKRENLQWLLGTFFQEGQDGSIALSYPSQHDESKTLGGAIYFGPQLSTNLKYVNFSAYISAGIFSFSDEVTVAKDYEIIYHSGSHFTAPGIKSGLALSFCYKRLSLTGGYQISMTSAQNSTIAYQGIEFGVGVKF